MDLDNQVGFKEAVTRSSPYNPHIPRDWENQSKATGCFTVRFLDKFLAVVDDYISSEDSFSVREIQQSMYISRSHFYRKMKEASSYTPSHLIRERKLNRAIQLLYNPTYSIGRIAYETGFSSPGYFCRCFKVKYGLPPGKYRKCVCGTDDN